MTTILQILICEPPRLLLGATNCALKVKWVQSGDSTRESAINFQRVGEREMRQSQQWLLSLLQWFSYMLHTRSIDPFPKSFPPFLKQLRKRTQLVASWKCTEFVAREVQVLPSGKIGDCLLTGTRAIVVCCVYLDWTGQGDSTRLRQPRGGRGSRGGQLHGNSRP